MGTTKTRTQLENIIQANSSIADTSDLLQRLIRNVPGPDPVIWQKSNRQAHLQPLTSFFQQTGLDSLPTPTSRPLPQGFDPRFNDANDPIALLFETIFSDPRGLQRRWMRELDEHIAGISRRVLAEIDLAARSGSGPVRKRIVLVGGGPLTSIVASILAPFYEVIVITDERRIGCPWRNRPFWINSSCVISDFSAPALPLLGGPTTHMVNSRQCLLNVDLLLGGETKTVVCDDGSTAEYVPGTALGDLIATNLLLDVDEFLVGQRVDIPRLRCNRDGSVLVTIVDTESGTQRTLRAEAIFFLTGPGREQTKIADSATQLLYRQAAQQLDDDLRRAQSRLAPYREYLRQAEGRADIPQVQGLRREMAQLANDVELPQVLTMTAIQKLYEFWSYDLDYDPDAYVFAPLLSLANTIGFVGNGDTMRTLKELIDRGGPSCAYPTSTSPVDTPRAAIYNEPTNSPEEYDRANRRRYEGVYTDRTRSIRDKAIQYCLYRFGGESFVRVTHLNAVGEPTQNYFKYLFDATGLERLPLEDLLPEGIFDIRYLEDQQGNVLARGDEQANLYIVGSAACLPFTQLPPELQVIVRELEIPENTISLWLNGLLAERMAYTFAATRRPTRAIPQVS